jgi:hypothetical protein
MYAGAVVVSHKVYQAGAAATAAANYVANRYPNTFNTAKEYAQEFINPGEFPNIRSVPSMDVFFAQEALERYTGRPIGP